jgi:hypothetical protein
MYSGRSMSSQQYILVIIVYSQGRASFSAVRLADRFHTALQTLLKIGKRINLRGNQEEQSL